MWKTKPPSEAAGQTPPQAPARLRRLCAAVRRLAVPIAAHPVWTALLIVAVAAPLAPVVATRLVIGRMHLPSEMPPTLAAALDFLDRGREADAQRLAERLETAASLAPDELGGPRYVLGVAASRRAEQLAGIERRRRYALAARLLAESRRRGFPAGREPEGLFLLGKCLLAGGRTAESRPVLREALKQHPRRKTELHRLLADALAAAPKPNFDQALRYNQRWLDTVGLPDDERRQALVQRAQIQLAKGDLAACRKTLAQIPADAKVRAEMTLLAGRLLLADARALEHPSAAGENDEITASYERAVTTLREAARQAQADRQVRAAAMLLMGTCQLESGNARAALDQFERTYHEFADTPLGFAAAVEEAWLLNSLGRFADAMAIFRVVLPSFDEVSLQDPWLTAAALQARMVQVYQELLKHEQFELAASLAGLLDGVLGPRRATQLLAQAQETWGRSLLARADGLPQRKAALARRQGRRILREAGQTFRRLAALRVGSREYPRDLVKAADSALAGHDFDGAIRALQEFLRVAARDGRPSALVKLSRALLSRGRTSDALGALRECIELYPAEAAALEARLLAASAYAELGQFEPAEALLLDNLEGDALSPASREWRDSLFALGRVLFQAGRYRDAIRRFEEAAMRYPAAPEALEIQYLAAEAYRRSANEVQAEIDSEPTAEGRLAGRHEFERLLEAALAHYGQALDMLRHRPERPDHAGRPDAQRAHDDSMQRNCHYARGSVLFALQRYDEAIQAYSSVTDRYPQPPEALEAYVQIAACYRRLGRTVEARGTLQQAKYALKRFPEHVALDKTTNLTRDEWGRMLDSLGTL